MEQLPFFSTESTRTDDNSILDIISGNAAIQFEVEPKITFDTIFMTVLLIFAAGFASLALKKLTQSQS